MFKIFGILAISLFIIFIVTITKGCRHGLFSDYFNKKNYYNFNLNLIKNLYFNLLEKKGKFISIKSIKV